ncbi:MAG: S8 family serine peptidase [Nitrospirae bacterium]|nr:S8 family serine peptidase [Nitrospirota bacterium]
MTHKVAHIRAVSVLVGGMVFLPQILLGYEQNQVMFPERPNAPFISNEIIVKYKPHAKSDPKSKKIFHGRGTPGNLADIRRVEVPKGKNVETFVEEQRMNPDVEYAEMNYVLEISGTLGTAAVPNDPLYSQQWALPKIQAPQAWDLETGKPRVVVAVVDTGVDYRHPDLSANIWTNEKEIPENGMDDDGNGFVDDYCGYDFVSIDPRVVYPGEDAGPRDNDPMDVHGHGTHVSGIVGAVPNNAIGISGVNWGSRIMALRAGFKNMWGGGSLLASDIAAAMVYAADNGAKVINMSWGAYGLSKLLTDAINYAHDSGVVLVAAAGNYNRSDKFYPAAFPNVIAVSATDPSDNKAYFSNYGDWIELAAPGTYIYSTLPGGRYAAWSGTSMAAPFVAGLAGLVLSQTPGYTNEEVRQVLADGADDLGAPGRDPYFGFGRINVFNSLRIVPVTPILIDIKPGSFPNSINLRSSGVIPVAIPSTEEFQAASVDVETVRFGPAGAGMDHSAFEDVDQDGDLDLVLHFRTQETGLEPGDTQAALTGKTLKEHGSRPIVGVDSVRIVPVTR